MQPLTEQVELDFTDELRARAGLFADEHVGLWVAVTAPNTVNLGGARSAEVLRAAADWLAADESAEVTALAWSRSPEDPPLRLSMRLAQAPVK
ncbi:hypothetical protein ABZ929_06270 [Streptomyces physcomitrii]|uniref:hypothetical protein n=1 Tax=Streptomyces physcomitrii TaxID=2724184 RepID=UPI0033C6FA06